ncbi:MAG: hypothetical protein M0Z94_02580 [Dehalococcoidales bacterium]|nr:hypothetical protein [Dehalococcoidales bacterium]
MRWPVRVGRLLAPLCAALLLLGGTVQPAAADVGPKPEVVVGVYYGGQSLPYTQYGAAILSCATGEARLAHPDPSWGMSAVPGLENLDLSDPSGCRWGYPLAPVSSGPTEDGKVRFSYMVPSRFRLAVYVPASGQTFLTAPVDRDTLRARFRVDLASDGTATISPTPQPVWESDWRWELACLALPLTLIVELAIVLLWARRSALPARPLFITGLIANLLTLPLVWLVVLGVSYLLGGPAAFVALAFLEVLAVFFEGSLYWKGGKLRLGNALALSMVANLASFSFGALVH